MAPIHPVFDQRDHDATRDRFWSSVSAVSPDGDRNLVACSACGEEHRVTDIRRVQTSEGELWVTICLGCLWFAKANGVDELKERIAAIRAQAAAEGTQLSQEWESVAA